MNELSLAEELLEIIQQKARKEGFSTVTHIDVELGQLSEASPEALRLCLEGIIRNTLAHNAKVNIFETAAKARCLNCGHINTIEQAYSACDECGGFDLKLLSGDQVLIKNLDVR